MKLKEIKKILNAEEITETNDLDKEVIMACGSDLMSDVLSYIKADSLLLTGLINPQVVRTAEMAEIAVICFVRGKSPPKETVSLAKEKGVPILVTNFSMFETCGRLYVEGLHGCDETV